MSSLTLIILLNTLIQQHNIFHLAAGQDFVLETILPCWKWSFCWCYYEKISVWNKR